MCRLFFIFDHILTINEIKKIAAQRTQKKSRYSLSNRDNGPRIDGMGIAYRHKDKWVNRSCPMSPEICIQLLLDLPKIKEPTIIHLRQRCTNNCKESTAEIMLENTHPFLYRDTVFAHNGQLYNFDMEPMKLMKYIDKDLQEYIFGKTDSEKIFYVFLTAFRKFEKKHNVDFQEIHKNVLVPFFEILSKEYPKYLANFIFSNSDFSIVTRYKHGITGPALSLYYSVKNGLVISSEPIGSGYRIVPEQTVIYVDHKTKHAFLQSIE